MKIVVGGAERWQSVENGVNALTSDAEFVLVHDVARPFISKEIIRDVCETLVTKGSCLVAKPAVDTIKIAKDGCVQQTIDRNTVWMAQTPQAASIALLKKLYGRIAAEPLNFRSQHSRILRRKRLHREGQQPERQAYDSRRLRDFRKQSPLNFSAEFKTGFIDRLLEGGFVYIVFVMPLHTEFLFRDIGFSRNHAV